MATISEFFTNKIRYDLRDFGGQDYDDDQLLEYLNRSIRILDMELMRLRSDYTVNSDTVTLLEDAYSVALPTNASTIRRIYYGQIEKYEKSWDNVFKRRILWNGTTGEPTYWTQRGDNIEWDQVANDDYEYTVVYDKWTGDLTVSDNMPYSDDFNNYLVHGTTIFATSSKKDQPVQADQQVHSLFRSELMRNVIVRNFVRRPYTMDF
jgi:hypothetical protein